MFAAFLAVLAAPAFAAVWTPAGANLEPRWNTTFTRLTDGKVLAAAGYVGSAEGVDPAGPWLETAELFDPGSSAWSATGSLTEGGDAHVSALLPDGRVLVAAGARGMAVIDRAELYRPSNGTWTPTARLRFARTSASGALLSDGRVLVVGGFNGEYVREAELYDPRAGAWGAAGTLAQGRTLQAMAVLLDGRVLVAGGRTTSGTPLASVEIFDPATRTWSAGPAMSTARASPTATVLADGRVLVAGGEGAGGEALRSAELLDAGAAAWSPAAPMSTPRSVHTATLLPDGEVLVAGGYAPAPTASVEIYDPGAGAWRSAPALDGARAGHSAILLLDQRVLVGGGDPLAGANAAQTASYRDLVPGLSTVPVPSLTAVNGSTAPVAAPGSALTAAGSGLLDPGRTSPRLYLMPHADAQWGFTEGPERLLALPAAGTIPAGYPCGWSAVFAVAGGAASNALPILVLPAVPGAAPSAVPSPFSAAGSSWAVVSWAAAAGASDYVVQASTAADFSGSLLGGFPAPGGLSAVVEGLAPGTTYHFRAAAATCGGTGPFAALGSTLTAPGIPVGTLRDSLGAAGGSLEARLPWGVATLRVPPGALAGPTQFAISPATSFPAAFSPVANLRGAALGVVIDVEGSPRLAREATLTLPFRPQDVVGAKGRHLMIARYDAEAAAWTPLATTLDREAGLATARTTRFSPFQLMIVPSIEAAVALGPKAYPNPLRPARGQREMTLARLPPDAEIRILSWSGARVRRLRSDGAGMAAWDGRDDAGRPAGSGVYFVVVAGSNRTFKVAIQR